jgi:PAS domain S-box-containing protein
MKTDELPSTQRSPARLFITIIIAIFIAEVVAMIVVYLIQPVPYFLGTLIDAGIMTTLMFPVLYYLSFHPLLRHIEERRQAEDSLLRSRQLQERFFNSIDTLIAYMDRDFNFIRVNDAYARADGRQPEFFFDKNHFDLYPHPENQVIFQRVVETGEPYWVYEKPFEYPEHLDRGVMYWDWRLQPVKGIDGRVEGLVLSLLNVTERKRAQDANQQLSRIVEQTEDSVVVTDCDGVIEYVNPAFERLTGYLTDEVIGKTPRLLKSGLHDQQFYEELWGAILRADVFQSEIANRKKNGELFYEVKTITPLRNADGDITHFVATGKDITEHKHQEEEISRAYDQLELRVYERTEQLRLANAELEQEINIRARTEEALRQSELGLKRAQAMSHLGNWELDPLKDQLTWSDEVYRIFGLQPQQIEVSYEAFLEAVHPDDRAVVDQAYSDSIRDGQDGYEIEHRIIRQPRGEIRNVHEKCEHMRNESGEIIRSVGMVHDITERKQAEELLQKIYEDLELRVQERTEELAAANTALVKEIAERKEIERQLRIQTTAMEAAANGIVITDRQGNIQWTNPALVEISGYDTHYMIGQNMKMLQSGQHDATYYHHLWETILSGQVWRGEIVNRRKDGSLYVEEQTITPVRDDQGEVVQFIAIKQDVTERKRGEEAVRESEEKFRTLVEWTYDWEFWVDPGGHLIYTSPSCERITGFSPEEFIADPDTMTKIVHAKDRSIFKKHQEIIHSELAGVEKMEFRIITRAGKECWLEHICRPLFGAENRYLGRRVSNRDITERKQAEKLIRERNRKEKLLTQTIHTMQLDIARDLHDTLGQNIGFLRMKLDYLAEKKIRKPGEMRLELQSMARAANESYDLIRGTLAVLQSESSTDLFSLFTRYAGQIEERSGCKINFVSEGETRFMTARRMRQLFYVFREILNNIEKHAHATEVFMELKWDADCLHLYVSDNGSGFDLEKTPYGGHYGMKFMRDRVELLNGSLTIQSAVGSGTRIKLEVPYE